MKDALAPTQGLEALKDSIGGLETRSAGFLERKVEVDRALGESYSLQSQLLDEHATLEVDCVRLFEERERLLQAQLDSEGLATCSVAVEPYHHHYQYENTVWGSADPLRKYGVFPKTEMTMVYSHETYQRMEGGAYGGWVTRQSTDLSILCPSHAPGASRENYSKPSKYGKQYGPDVWTRVTAKDGKLVKELDGEELHGAPRQGRLAQAVYEHFGYPGVPNIPDRPAWR